MTFMPSNLVYETTESTNPIPSYVRAVYTWSSTKPIIHHCLCTKTPYINFVYQTFGCQATTTKSIKYKGIESALI